jgi:hypothetical protein
MRVVGHVTRAVCINCASPQKSVKYEHRVEDGCIDRKQLYRATYASLQAAGYLVV